MGRPIDVPPGILSMPDASSEAPVASFEAATPLGPVRLLLRPTDALIRHAVDAALCLDRNEPLLAALDDWLGTDLDWRWAPVPMTPEGAMARWRDQCLLDLPWRIEFAGEQQRDPRSPRIALVRRPRPDRLRDARALGQRAGSPDRGRHRRVSRPPKG